MEIKLSSVMLQCAVNGLQLNTPRVARTHPQRRGGHRNEPTADKILISPRINLVLPKPTSNGGHLISTDKGVDVKKTQCSLANV